VKIAKYLHFSFILTVQPTYVTWGQYRFSSDIIVNTGEANVTETLFASFWFKSRLKSTLMISPAATVTSGLKDMLMGKV
jgi:hypothetical protein